MRAHLILVLVALVFGGAIECGRGALTETERYGAHLYGRMCAVCHGANGEGYKADEAPALAHPQFLGTVSDEFLRVAIAHGRTNTVMSAWASERGGPLGAEDINALIAFLHTWRRSDAAEIDESPSKGDSKRGAGLFARECVRCHGDRGVGGPNVSIGNADLLRTASDGFLRHAIREGRPGTPMPAFAASLGEQGVEDVVAYLRSLRRDARPHPQERPKPERPPPLPLGPVPLNPKGPEPVGFTVHPEATPTEKVKAALDRGARLALLDARTPSDYIREHIAGAVSVPFYDPTPYLKDLPKDAWLVCYCSCPSAESGMLAAALLKHGFKKVTVLKEGLRVWKSKNYPTTQGVRP